MDFNDLKSRLKRLYVTLNKRFDPYVGHKTVITHKVEGDIHVVGFHFDSADETEKNITIMEIVSAIASLKDHLKNELFNQHKEPQLVEDLINNSKELSIIIDLWNQDKHGTPLIKLPRSGTCPKIINSDSGLTITGGQQGRVTFEVTPTGSSFSSATDNMVIHIDGDVVDEHNNFIMSVEEMISGAILDIEEFISSHGIKSSD